VGDAYDNALMESIIGLYKAECVDTDVFHPGPYKSLGDLEYATAGWVDWYNNRRLHSSLGYVPPDRVRTSPARCPQSRGAANMRAAQKPGRFTVQQPAPGVWIWRLPNGTDYLVTNAGTYNLGDGPFGRRIWRAAVPAKQRASPTR
jgi:hypothetical protein